MKFIIACGGTAGHINPGIAIAREIMNRLPGSQVIFVGAGRELEKRLVPEAGFELINIKMSGIKRGMKPGDIRHNILTLINLISAGYKAAGIIKQVQPDAVIGTGGYICYPVLKAAAKRKIPALIHESNARPGLTVKMLSRIADKIMITYPGFDKYYKYPLRLVITGTPLRDEFYKHLDNNTSQEQYDKPVVVSFWGSLGSERMNEIIAGLIKKNLDNKKFHHIHAAGNSTQLLIDALKIYGIEEPSAPYADIRSYIDDMPRVMRRADLVICRAGASTLSELAALGKPGILIPSPYVPDNVQYENARQLEKAGAAIIIDESECNAAMLYETVSALIDNREKLNEMSRAAATLATPEAAARIVDLILGVAQ